MQWRARADAVLAEYAIDARAIRRITQGLVNLTLAVEAADGQRYALQRLHPVFSDAVNANIASVTAHLARHGLLTPRLVPTRTGALSVLCDQEIWRATTWLDGRAYDALADVAQARAAGALLGRFHLALVDFSGPLVADRPPVHDYARHRAHLAATMPRHAGHRLQAAVSAAAAVLDTLHAALPAVSSQPLRTVHGDPKISNLLFSHDGREALAMLDLDTLAQMPLALELGDALRSWCNPHGEDAPEAYFDLARCDAALAGYASVARAFATAAEIAAIIPATLTIHLELAARFLADALAESYFGWDAARFPARGEHNLARTRGQLAAAQSLFAQRAAAEAIVRRHFGTG